MNKIITSIVIVIIIVIAAIMLFKQSVVNEPREVVSTPSATPNIGNPLPKTDVVRLTDPAPGETVTSPLSLKGEARGSWYTDGNFPIVIVDSTGKVIAEGVGKAAGDWQTNDFVPFSAKLTFTLPTSVKNRNATLILKKDSPSALKIPVVIK